MSFYRTFEKRRQALLLPRIVPYQPSADIQLHLRTLEQGPRRSRWQVAKTVQKTVQEYERHSRLGMIWLNVGTRARRHLLRCDAQLEAVFHGRPRGCALGPHELA